MQVQPKGETEAKLLPQERLRSHRDSQGAGAALLWGKAEGAGTAQPGEVLGLLLVSMNP